MLNIHLNLNTGTIFVPADTHAELEDITTDLSIDNLVRLYVEAMTGAPLINIGHIDVDGDLVIILTGEGGKLSTDRETFKKNRRIRLATLTSGELTADSTWLSLKVQDDDRDATAVEAAIISLWETARPR